jgi:sulfoxide reductase catalytic subunit YedY
MFIHRRRGWEIPESCVTAECAGTGPQRAAFQRRDVARYALGGLLLGATAGGAWAADGEKYPVGRALTPERDVTTYNNYYEFGTSKAISATAEGFPMAPWSVQIDGMVARPRSIALDDLLKQVALEDRVYRHRCVEAWAMTVPWTGFPLAALLRLAEPMSGAKYVVFQTAEDRKHMPGLRQSWYPWPYIEAVTLEEAGNDLAFLATGLYGKPLLAQNGGPIRLVLPWKYGFKSAKALVRVSFTDKRPKTFWSIIGPDEYGFWANVNPAVPHPRWSQANERLIGSGEMVPTLIYNGYGPFVAGLYTDKTSEKLFM